jgi:hypothetical protein
MYVNEDLGDLLYGSWSFECRLEIEVELLKTEFRFWLESASNLSNSLILESILLISGKAMASFLHEKQARKESSGFAS